MQKSIVCGIILALQTFLCAEAMQIANPSKEAKANVLFLSAANVGITLGTSLCGLFISLNGSRFAVLAAVCLVVLSIIFLMLRGQILKDK